MHVSKVTLTLLSLLPLLACDPGPSGDEGNAAGTGDDGAATDGGTEDPPAGDSGSSDGGSAPTTDAADSTGADTTGGDDDADTGDAPPTECSEATLFMGSPYFTGDLENWNAAGQGLLDEPPLRTRHLAVTGSEVAIETQFEIWVTEGDQVRRIAGDEEEIDTQYQPSGPCADVRLIIADGMTSLPNGNLVVADKRGNGVIEISDPLGDCTAAPIAGNPDVTLDLDISDGAAAIGDVDGPGAQARFDVVGRPAADDQGNVYVIDSGNSKLKQIAADADRTVTTIYEFTPDEKPWGITVLDGIVYLTGSNGSEDVVWSVDPVAKSGQVIYHGRGLFDEIDSSHQAQLAALTNDGVDLIVASTAGYLFRMSTAAEPLGAIAGYGSIVDYPTDLDLSQPIPTSELPIRSYAISEAGLVRRGDDFLLTNNANGVGFHVWAIHCM